MGEYILGMDIGGTNIRIGAQNREGTFGHFIRVPRLSVMFGEKPAERLAEFIEHYRAKELEGGSVDAIAIGFPSTLSKDRRTILQTPNIDGLDHVEIVDLLEHVLKFPVFLEKDVNLLFLNDMKVLKIPDQGIHIGVYVGTGIGNSICMNGMPLIGKNGVAGELGHLANIGGIKKCGCGNVGCSECYAAGWRLEEIWKENFSDIPLHDVFSYYTDRAILTEFIDAIACVIASEVNILDPDTIVLGGGVIHMADFPKTLLNGLIAAHARKPYPSDNLSIYYAEDSVESGVRGALVYAAKKLEEKVR